MSIEITLCNITKTFGVFRALHNIDLNIPNGELTALLGPSGSGKTTLLRIIAGLEIPDANHDSKILFSGQNIDNASMIRQHIGFVFQSYALFRHMTIFENIAFGLRVRPRALRYSRKDIRDKVHDLLKLIQLEGLHSRYPAQLSGGQRQRVALARALAIEPKVLLLDEPFGALDAKVRQELRYWLRRLHDQLHVTSVFVTHDQEEALEVADRIVIMNQGKIEQIGSPQEVYDHPATPFVYNFLGNVNLFHGRVNYAGRINIGGIDLAISEHPQLPEQTDIVAYVRSHDIELDYNYNESAIPVVVLRINTAGPIIRVELKCRNTGKIIEAQITRDKYRNMNMFIGQELFAVLKNPRIFV